MNVIAEPLRQPILHRWVFMGSVVVEHEMNLQTEEHGNMLGTRLGCGDDFWKAQSDVTLSSYGSILVAEAVANLRRVETCEVYDES
jgi:hypothetical protein